MSTPGASCGGHCRRMPFAAEDNLGIESKLDEADYQAKTISKRYSHEEVFDALRAKIRKGTSLSSCKYII